MNRVTGRIRKGDTVRIRWKDSVEGPVFPNLEGVPQAHVARLLTAEVTTIGRFLKVSHGYLVMTDVLQEEEHGKVFFEKQGGGKWISVPLSSVREIVPAGEVLDAISRETRRRRTIVRQLRFIPRVKRLANGDLSRTLYVV